MLLLLAAAFVGNSACKPCHASIVERYERTPMARSTSAVNGGIPPGSFRHRASGNEYSIAADGRVTIRNRDAVEERKFEWSIGSGAAGFSYLVARDRFLFQAPITWYTNKKRWDASPGYESDPVMAWDRPVDPSCLSCHASRLTHIYGTFNRYGPEPFLQGGISCERCHGPGSEHIQSQGKMVVPTRLDAERRDDICRQCHLMGEARVPRPGRAFGEFRAGDRLGDFVAYFVADDPAGPALRSTSHIEKMAASRCKIAAGDRLWCGSCHDVHTTPEEPVAWYREKCLSCHSPDPCKRGPDCIACHMPKSKAVDAGHGEFTDHSIPRRPRRVTFETPKPWRLRPFSAADSGDRELGLAYAEAYRRSGDERQAKEAIRLQGGR